MIGVFDSGHGGLSVLRALVDATPDRRFVYLGDHANAPYGPRDRDDIHRLTLAGVERLFAEGCSLVVLACNTASAVSLRRMQREWLPFQDRWRGRNALGVLVPVVEAITRVPWMAEGPAERRGEPRTVGVFATAATVASRSFPAEIAKRAPDVTVIQRACPALVPLIEAGSDDDAIRPAVREYVDAMLEELDERRPDAVALGCTHYPLVAHLFAEALPKGVEILSQPTLVARSLEHYLERHPEHDHWSAAPLPPRFLTTGDPGRIGDLAGRLFKGPAPFQSA